MENSTSQSERNNNCLIFKTHTGFANVLISNILYCCADGSYTILHLSCGSKVRICMNLKTIEERLSTFGFMRCHHKWIFNLMHVESFCSRKKAISVSGITLPISRRRSKEVVSALLGKNIKDVFVSLNKTPAI